MRIAYTALVVSFSWIMFTIVALNNANWWQVVIAFISCIIIPFLLSED